MYLVMTLMLFLSVSRSERSLMEFNWVTKLLLFKRFV